VTAAHELASRRRRVLAAGVDVVVATLAGTALVLVSGAIEHAEDWSDPGQAFLRIGALGIAGHLLPNAWLLWRRGQTVGKWLLGIAIAAARTGAQVPGWRLLPVRVPAFLALFTVAWTPGMLLVLADHLPIFGRDRRCLHDRLCGSVVVRVGAGCSGGSARGAGGPAAAAAGSTGSG
jgi:uncharacterized RDD family membrane protein YckC